MDHPKAKPGDFGWFQDDKGTWSQCQILAVHAVRVQGNHCCLTVRSLGDHEWTIPYRAFYSDPPSRSFKDRVGEFRAIVTELGKDHDIIPLSMIAERMGVAPKLAGRMTWCCRSSGWNTKRWSGAEPYLRKVVLYREGAGPHLL